MSKIVLIICCVTSLGAVLLEIICCIIEKEVTFSSVLTMVGESIAAAVFWIWFCSV